MGPAPHGAGPFGVLSAGRLTEKLAKVDSSLRRDQDAGDRSEPLGVCSLGVRIDPREFVDNGGMDVPAGG